jgi:hypothetical protein
MSQNLDVQVLLPVHNEAESIEATIREIYAEFSPFVRRLSLRMTARPRSLSTILTRMLLERSISWKPRGVGRRSRRLFTCPPIKVYGDRPSRRYGSFWIYERLPADGKATSP